MTEQPSLFDGDPDGAAWLAEHPSWRLSGAEAVRAVCETMRTFTTEDVWRHWRTTQPREARAMAGVMDAAVRAGWCSRAGSVGGHRRRAGNAGYGALYRSHLVR